MKTNDFFTRSLFASFTLLFFSSVAFAKAPEIIMCIDDYPPYHMIPKNNGKPHGLHIDMINKIASRVGFVLKFSENTPFKRCLEQMKDGQVDLMTGILDSEDRANYMYLIEYKEASPKSFYYKTDRASELEAKFGTSLNELTFESLKLRSDIAVGTILGNKYFKEFDENTTIKKDSATSLEASIKKLKSKRVEILVSEEADMQLVDDKLAQGISKFPKMQSNDGASLYFALSKASPRANLIYERMNQVVTDMKKRHQFKKMTDQFNRNLAKKLQKKAKTE